jgi:hypothetical protein
VRACHCTSSDPAHSLLHLSTSLWKLLATAPRVRARAALCVPAKIDRYLAILPYGLVIARHSHIRIYCARRVFHRHPFRTCRTLRPLRTSRPSSQEGDTQAWASPHWCTERWLWSITQTRRRRMRRTAARRKTALTAHQQRSQEFQTRRRPVSHLYPSRSAIYTRPRCAQARKTIHRCTAVANE